MKRGTIIIDLDGTAVDTPRQKLPSNRLVAATEKLQEQYYVCAATGRSQSWAIDLIRPMGLKDPCIIAGGTSILDPLTERLIWRQSIDGSTIQDVIAIMQRSGQRVFFDDYTEQDYRNGAWPPEVLDDVHEAYFLELLFVPRPITEDIVAQLSRIKEICPVVVDSQNGKGCDIHIVHKDATKEQAIAELYTLLDADPLKSIGVGDGHNDLHLFNGVHHKVAMGNSVPDIKAAADQIIGLVADDGLAAYFEKLYHGGQSRL